MNYIKEVVEKVLPVAIGEEFNVIVYDGNYSVHNPFKFTETDLVNNNGDILNVYISTLITGEYKIEKIPFIPKVGDEYWSCDDTIYRYNWDNTTFHKERKLLGIVFRTEQEASDYLPTWKKRLEGERYENRR